MASPLKVLGNSIIRFFLTWFQKQSESPHVGSDETARRAFVAFSSHGNDSLIFSASNGRLKPVALMISAASSLIRIDRWNAFLLSRVCSCSSQTMTIGLALSYISSRLIRLRIRISRVRNEKGFSIISATTCLLKVDLTLVSKNCLSFESAGKTHIFLLKRVGISMK